MTAGTLTPSNQLLCGKRSYIHSWIVHGNEHGIKKNRVKMLSHIPKVVFVKYESESWTLPGMEESWLRPIRPWKRTWFIHKNAKKPILLADVVHNIVCKNYHSTHVL